MAVVLGLVAAAGVLSVQGIVGGRDDVKTQAREHLAVRLRFVELPLSGYLPQLWQQEAIDGGRDEGSLLDSHAKRPTFSLGSYLWPPSLQGLYDEQGGGCDLQTLSSGHRSASSYSWLQLCRPKELRTIPSTSEASVGGRDGTIHNGLISGGVSRLSLGSNSDQLEMPMSSGPTQFWLAPLLLSLWQQEALDGASDSRIFGSRFPVWPGYRDTLWCLASNSPSYAEALDGGPCYRNDGLRCLCLPGLGVLASDAEALDAYLSALRHPAGSPDFLARRSLARGDWLAQSEIMVAGKESGETIEALAVIAATPAGAEVIDGVHTKRGALEEPFWLISHYTAGVNYGNSSYPFGSATATGIPAQPGVVACGPSYLRKHVVIGGWEMVCADTGNPAYVYDGVADIWCESFDSWGPRACTDEWWCGLPCPAPCEVEIEGRCWAKARVME